MSTSVCLKNVIRNEIQEVVNSIKAFDHDEEQHIAFINNWIASGAEIFRIVKPATPDTHLVSYFLLLDQAANQVLLVNHKKAQCWLPAGGHVEPNEHPKETVKREMVEELGIDANFVLDEPLFVTVTKTRGYGPEHTDVSLWYILKGSVSDIFKYDEREFHQVQWFAPDKIPYHQADPHLKRCLKTHSF